MRQLKIQKRVGGKLRRYRNLATFNKECPSRGVRGNICELTNTRKLSDGSGLATVHSQKGPIRGRQGGTWLLHFASYDLMRRHLKKRTDSDSHRAARKGNVPPRPLAGARRRKRR